VINDYLAERFDYAAAYDRDAYLRARERLAMARWDGAIVPAFYGSLHDATTFDRTARAFIGDELDELLKTVLATSKRQASLLSFHCAPFWARMTWVRKACSVVTELIEERVMLRAWLDAAVEQPAVQATMPDRDTTLRRYRERFRGFRAAES
jgi:glutathione S-transferase